MLNPLGVSILRPCDGPSLRGFSENVIAGVLLFHERSVDEIALQAAIRPDARRPKKNGDKPRSRNPSEHFNRSTITLLGYDPAHDAPAGVSRRVARVIILAGVDHDCSAARMKNRVGPVFVERDGSIEDLDIKTAVRRNVQVRHIAGVPGTRHYAVMRVGWIKVPTGRGK